MVCPNKSSKEWIDLVDQQGEANAYFLWAKYDGEVPQEYYKIDYSLDRPATYKDLDAIASKFHLIKLGENLYAGSSAQSRALGKYAMRSNFRISTEPTNEAYNSVRIKFSILPTKKSLSSKVYNDTSIPDFMMEKMSKLFPNLKYNWINPEDLNQKEHPVSIDRVNAFVKNGVVYLVKGRVTAETAIEEALHPFVETIFLQNKELFNELLAEGKRYHKDLYKKIVNDYGELQNKGIYSADDMRKEFVTQLLSQYLSEEIKNPKRSLKEIIQKVFIGLIEAIKRAFQKYDSTYRLEISELDPRTSFAELAMILNAQDLTVSYTVDPKNTMYSVNKINDDPYEPDEKFVRKYTTEKKLERALAERKILEDILSKTNVKSNNRQTETVTKLLNNNAKLVAFLEKVKKQEEEGKVPNANISVSSAIGSSDFKTDKDYSAYKNFGIFMHNFLDEAQKTANQHNLPLRKVLTREMFSQMLKESQEKEPFSIEGLTEDVMFTMAEEIIDAIGGLTGDVILIPELSIIAEGRITDALYKQVIGRIDLMLVDATGKVKIIDFKTKKVQTLVDTYVKGEPVLNHSHVTRELSIKRNIVDSNPEIIDFSGKTRSTFDTWTAQLLMYRQMLLKAGVNVSGTSVISLLYQTDSNDVYEAHTTKTFEGNLYEYVDAVYTASNKPGGFTFSKVGEEEYKESKRIIEGFIELPLSEEKKKELMEQRAEFNMTPDDNERFRSALKALVEEEQKQIPQQLDELYKNLNEARKEDNQNEINLIQSRIDNLKNRDTTLKSFYNNLQDTSKDIGSSLKTSLAIDVLATDINKLYDIFLDVDKYDINNTTNQKRLLELFRSMKSVKVIFDIINDSLIAAVNSDSNPDFTQNHPIFKQMKELDIKIADMEGRYRKYSLDTFVSAILSTMDGRIPEIVDGQVVFKTRLEKIDEEAKQAYQQKLIRKKETLEKMKATGKLPISSKLKLTASRFLDKEKYAEMLEGATVSERDLQKAVTKLEEEIEYLETIVNGGYNFDRDSLSKYITGITDKSSRMYIGKTDRTAIGTFGFSLDSLIAGASNSEIAISGLVQYLKNSEIEAKQTFQNDIERNKIQQKLDAFKKGRTDEEMNDKIIERRKSYRQNPDGTISENETLIYVKPTSEEYDNKLNYFGDMRRIIAREINDQKKVVSDLLRDQRNLIANKQDANALIPKINSEKQKLKAIVEKREALKKEEYQWHKENSTTKFVEEYYDVFDSLPAELATKLEDIYLELDLIKRLYGKGNEMIMPEEDYDQMRLLEIEAKKIRQEAQKLNPTYYEKIRLLEQKYFEYVPDERGFETAYNKRKDEYAGQPEKLKEWEKENILKVPTQEYYDELEQAYEELERVFGGMDPVLGELYKERRNIMKPYRVNNSFDGTYMLDSEIERLNEINETISDIIDNRPQEKLTPEQGAAIKNLNSLRVKGQLSEIYKDQRTKYYGDMEKAYRVYKAYQAAADKAVVPKTKDSATKESLKHLEIYYKKQEEFVKWFNRNHTVKIEEGTNVLEGSKNIAFNSVNPMWRETVPAQERHYERKLASKWYTRRLKINPDTNRPYAYNEKYKELPDGTPLPKGLEYDSDNNLIITSKNSNINPKYIDLLNDKEAYEYYKAFSEMFFSQQKRTTGTNLGYKVPGIKATFIQNLKRKGLADLMKAESAKMKDNLFSVAISQEDLMTNYYGDLGNNSIRFRFNEQYDENLQTEDGINAGIQWLLESYINIAMSKSQPISDMMIDTVKTQLLLLKEQEGNSEEYKLRIKELEAVLVQMEFERNKFIAGQFESYNNPAVRKMRKLLNNAFTAVSFSRLGFDAATQVKNWASGSIQTFLNSYSSNHYNKEDMLFAQRQLMKPDGFFKNYINDWGKIGDLSLDTMLYRSYNPSQKDFYKYLENTTGSKQRRILEKANFFEIAYMLQDKGDTEIALKTWLSIMNHYRFPVIEHYENGKPVYKKDKDGNDVTVTAYEAYEKSQDGELRIREDVDFTKDDEKMIRNAVWSEIRRAQGNYAKSDATKLESTLFGQMAMFFRKYLVPFVLNRVGSLRPNWEGSEMSMGYWRAIVNIYQDHGIQQALASTFLGGWTKKVFKKDFEEKLTPFYKKRTAQARVDLTIGLLLTIAVWAVLRKIKEMQDDDEEIPLLAGNLAYVLMGVKQETAAFTPMPGIGSFDDYIRNFFTISTAVSDAKKLIKAVEHTAALSVYYAYGREKPEDDDNSFFASIYRNNVYQKKVGVYERNTPKALKDFHDLTGYKNIRNMFNPEYRIELLSRFN